MKQFLLILCLASLLVSCGGKGGRAMQSMSGNPILDGWYADPEAIIYDDTYWIYPTWSDVYENQVFFDCFSSKDLVTWTKHPAILDTAEVRWAKRAMWAPSVIRHAGRYYLFFGANDVHPGEVGGIGVAVADRPEGPYRDAIGRPLLTNEDCFDATHSWVCIDPAVFIDDDGQAWIFWGNKVCYCARLKRDMTEIDGPIKRIDRKEFDFTEAPWVHKYNGKYYLTFATGWPEKIAYAMSDRPDGPYEYKGIISEIAGNCNTTHPSIVEFRGKWYFFTHNGGLPDGTSYSRSVCLEPLEYNADGTIRKIHPSTESIFGK